MSERKFKGGSEEVISHLYQTYPDRSQPSSDVVPTGRPSDAIAKDGSWRFRQRQGRGTNWHYGNMQHFLLHRQVREEETHHSKICVVRFLDSYRIIKMYSHFPAVHYVWCKDVKGAMVLFFVEWTLMKVARHDTITKISGLVGNPCVCQLCVGWRYHQMVSRLTSFSQHGRASKFW